MILHRLVLRINGKQLLFGTNTQADHYTMPLVSLYEKSNKEKIKYILETLETVFLGHFQLKITLFLVLTNFFLSTKLC